MNPLPHATRNTEHGTAFIVRWRGYPIYFHTNLCGRMYTPKTLDSEATAFPTIELAWDRAREHHLKWADIEIVPLI